MTVPIFEIVYGPSAIIGGVTSISALDVLCVPSSSYVAVTVSPPSETCRTPAPSVAEQSMVPTYTCLYLPSTKVTVSLSPVPLLKIVTLTFPAPMRSSSSTIMVMMSSTPYFS